MFILLFASFGWLTPWLGFYWDDWPAILTARLRETNSFWQFFGYNRPVSAWIYLVTFPVLGTRPFYWQVFALLLRWLTCVSMWWTLRLTWPKHKVWAAWPAFLFAIYPVFTQQAISVAYTQHWTCYLLFMFSLGSMLLAQRVRQRGWHERRGLLWFWILSILSWLSFLLEIFSMEYFAGLELVRPLLLWFAGTDEGQPRAARLKSTLVHWLPYLAGTAGFLAWRFFFVSLANPDVNSPSLLAQSVSAPVATISRFLRIALQDLLYLLVQAWTNLFNTPIDLGNRFLLLTWGLAILVAAAIFVYLYHSDDQTPDLPGRSSVLYQSMLIGALATVAGIFPVWATGRSVTEGMYANRFGLASMFGTSLLLISVIAWLVNNRRKQILIFSLLIGIAAAYHIQTSNDYRWIWVKQTRFYWQLKWRAPDLKPQTAIFSDGEIFNYMGLYPTSLAINVLYLNHMNTDDLSYWFYSLGRDFEYNMDDFAKGMDTRSTHRNYIFRGNTHEGIVIQYLDDNDCLEVLSPDDGTAPGLEPFARQAVPYSNLARITSGPGSPGTPAADIFGPEPEHGWCYFYQKASLAGQNGNWQQVVALGEQARASGYQPKASASNTSFEWLPFIEGYARSGDWQKAQDLSLAAFEKDQRIDASMCRLWDRLAASTAASPMQDEAVSTVRNQIKCPQ